MNEITNKQDNAEKVDKVNCSQSDQIEKLTAEKAFLEKKTNDRLKQEDNTTLAKTTSFYKKQLQKSHFKHFVTKEYSISFPKNIEFLNL